MKWLTFHDHKWLTFSRPLTSSSSWGSRGVSLSVPSAMIELPDYSGLLEIRASVFYRAPFLFGPVLSLLFLPLDDYKGDVVILGGIGCVI